MIGSYGIYRRDTFNTCLYFFALFWYQFMGMCNKYHRYGCDNDKLKHILKYASIQTPWVTWYWEWFLWPDQIASQHRVEGSGERAASFYNVVYDPLSEWVWGFEMFSGDALTMPLSSLLSSHNSFVLWGCAPKTTSLLLCANKQPMVDGAWKHVELMLCRICSIQLLIMREYYFPLCWGWGMGSCLGILVFLNVLQNGGIEYVQVADPLIFCPLILRKSFVKLGRIWSSAVEEQEFWRGKAQSWTKIWSPPSLQLPSLLSRFPVNLITFSRKTDAEKSLMKTSILYIELQQQRVFNKKGINANYVSLHCKMVISLWVVILHLSFRQQENNMQHLQESNSASFSFTPQLDFRGNVSEKCIEILVSYTGISYTDDNNRDLKILVIKKHSIAERNHWPEQYLE